MAFGSLLACAIEPQIAGSGTSTGNARVAGILYHCDGSPAAFTPMVLLPADFDPMKADGLPLTSLDTTDSAGRYLFESRQAGEYTLDGFAFASRQRQIVPDITLPADSILERSDTLRPVVTVSALLPDSIAAAGGYVYIPGTRLFSSVTSGQRYITLDSLPAGADLPLLYSQRGSTEPPVLLDDNAFLFDDFSDGDGYAQLRRYATAGAWCIYTDQEKGGSSSVEPAGARSDFKQAISDTAGIVGHGVHARFIFRTGYAYPYGGLTCRFTAADSLTRDLSKMQSLSFSARGCGRFFINIASRRATASYPSQEEWGQLGKMLTLSSSWQQITIDTDELRPPDGTMQAADSLRWSDVCDSVIKVTFAAWIDAGDTAEIFLDNIYINGMQAEDFIR